MARTVAQKCSRQLWTEVRKFRNCKSNLTNCIDKKTGSESIAELFSEKYRELYNFVSYELEQMATSSNDNKSDISMYCLMISVVLRTIILSTPIVLRMTRCNVP